jgi:thiol-disulfide isomerase/thioredoxin
MEQEILKMTQSLGVGAQFGGKYFCHDVRVIRMPRHGASLPIGLGVSCSADRQVLGKITKDGVYLEELEHNPAQYLPEVEQALGGEVVKIDLDKPMKEILAKYGGFYLGSIGGAAANLAEHCIKKVEVVEYPELGMEAIWRIEVVDFPAFIIVDDKGNDFFKELNLG